MASTLGQNQPFRYRGYLYDAETGWYYLQSRYYDPEVRRFISADVLLSTGQGVLGHNSFAYCNNNPIVLNDSEGTYPVAVNMTDGGSSVHSYDIESIICLHEMDSFVQKYSVPSNHRHGYPGDIIYRDIRRKNEVDIGDQAVANMFCELLSNAGELTGDEFVKHITAGIEGIGKWLIEQKTHGLLDGHFIKYEITTVYRDPFNPCVYVYNFECYYLGIHFEQGMAAYYLRCGKAIDDVRSSTSMYLPSYVL